ncbi:MAG TPA: ThiF family adenylyltransferase [Candidatus Lokiarchaeia archaeon]|nr:ThiF family adenylyltransferase [Candidatus Lokiarchaeia archaeon]
MSMEPPPDEEEHDEQEPEQEESREMQEAEDARLTEEPEDSDKSDEEEPLNRAEQGETSNEESDQEESETTGEEEPGTPEERSKEEEKSFQEERENLTWNAAIDFKDSYAEDKEEIVSSKEREIYARQALLKGWNQQVLKKSRILVAGLGILGRELVKNLALIGVGNITLVDPSYIENTMKSSFLIPPFEGKQAKVDMIKEQLIYLNQFMKVETYDKSAEDLPLSVFKENEIVVGCMNNFKSRAYLHEVCKRFAIPYAEGAILGLEGFVQAWMPGDEDEGVREKNKSPVEDDGEVDQSTNGDASEGGFSPVYADELDQDIGTSNEAAASILAGILGQEIIKIAFKLQKGDIGEVQQPRYVKYDAMKGLFDANPDRKDLLMLKDKKYALDSELLKKSTIFIAGVGALGCEITKDLALAGVGKLVLVDLDTIETSNLSRQLLFRMDDIGKPKAEVAATRVKELNPDTEVEFYFQKIQELPLDLYEKCDVIIAALDNVQARFDLNVIARRAKRPMIEGGTVGFEGHVQVIVPEGAKFLDETACYRCVVPIPPPDKRLIAACTPKGIPQVREHCVLRAEFIFRKKLEREPDLKNKDDLILLAGASNKELEMLKERDSTKDHGNPFVPQDMENILENKIPAIQTVSAVIASIESMEAMKMACIQNAEEKPVDYKAMEPTYVNYNGMYGIFDHLPVLKREDCVVCGTTKGIEYVSIPIMPDSTIEDILLSLQKIGTITEDQKFMITNATTKGIIYHPSIPTMSDGSKLLADIGIGPGTDVLLTPFGVPKPEDGSEPTKYQVSFVQVS